MKLSNSIPTKVQWLPVHFLNNNLENIVKKFVKVATLTRLKNCMVSNNFDYYIGDNTLKVFNFSNVADHHSNIVKMDLEDIKLIIDFIVENQNQLENEQTIIEVMADLCRVYYRKSSGNSQYYFKMENGDIKTKISSIKAIREFSRRTFLTLPNTPYTSDFGSLRWAKFAVESDCWFGPVSKSFIDASAEFSHLMEISTKPGNILYKHHVGAFYK